MKKFIRGVGVIIAAHIIMLFTLILFALTRSILGLSFSDSFLTSIPYIGTVLNIIGTITYSCLAGFSMAFGYLAGADFFTSDELKASVMLRRFLLFFFMFIIIGGLMNLIASLPSTWYLIPMNITAIISFIVMYRAKK